MNADRARRAVVFLSKSKSIYQNLAFEDWLFRHYDFSDTDGLLVWYNKPAVVVGRHQNVFNECNIQFADSMNVELARRQSGGGTVFHPKDNVNISFLTSNKRYNRMKNLEIVRNVLEEKFNVKTRISPRHDLLLNGLKISGSASKLSSKAAYHHCTLLGSIVPQVFDKVLESSFSPFRATGRFVYRSNATESVRSKVGWLAKAGTHIILSDVISALIDHLSTLYPDKIKVESSVLKDVEMNDLNYPGISDIERELRSWQWIYGSNPPFSLTKLNPNNNSTCLELNIEKGLIKSVFNDDAAQNSDHLIDTKFDLSIWNKLFFNQSSVKLRL